MLQLSLNRRFKNGANIQTFYISSKSLDTRSFDPAFTLASAGTSQTAGNSPQDINNRRLNYAPSDFDRTHEFQLIGVQELPFGRGHRFLSNAGGVAHRLVSVVLNAAERVTLELRADFTNFTKSPSFGYPTTITIATFGRIRDTVVSSSRQTMLAAKISF